jgi:hypothetical protein
LLLRIPGLSETHPLGRGCGIVAGHTWVRSRVHICESMYLSIYFLYVSLKTLHVVLEGNFQ